MLKQGLMCKSKSLAGETLFLVKKEGKIHPVVDYRSLNEVTIRDSGPTLLTTKTLDQLRTANIFTKNNLRNALN